MLLRHGVGLATHLYVLWPARAIQVFKDGFRFARAATHAAGSTHSSRNHRADSDHRRTSGCRRPVKALRSADRRTVPGPERGDDPASPQRPHWLCVQPPDAGSRRLRHTYTPRLRFAKCSQNVAFTQAHGFDERHHAVAEQANRQIGSKPQTLPAAGQRRERFGKRVHINDVPALPQQRSANIVMQLRLVQRSQQNRLVEQPRQVRRPRRACASRSLRTAAAASNG